MTATAQRNTQPLPTEEEAQHAGTLLDSVIENTVKSTYAKIADPSREAREWGTMLHQAGLATTPGGGAVVAMICFTEGLSFREFNRRYYPYNGTLTMRAGAAYADYLAAGGKVDFTRWDSTICTGRWTYGDFSDVEISFTLEEATKAGLLKKDNWQNYPGDMLFNRCVMRALRRVAPNIVAGVYDPDELDGQAASDKPKQSRTARKKELEQLASQDVAGEAAVHDPSPLVAEPPPLPATSVATPQESEPPFIPDDPAMTSAPTIPVAPPQIDYASGSQSPQSPATPEQLNELASCGQSLGWSIAEISEICVKRYNCKPDLSDLPRTKAAETIDNMRTALAEKLKPSV